MKAFDFAERSMFCVRNIKSIVFVIAIVSVIEIKRNLKNAKLLQIGVPELNRNR